MKSYSYIPLHGQNMYYDRFLTERERVIQGLSNNTSKTLQLQTVSDEVGRGVFACESIKKGEYICEYRTNAVYETQEEAWLIEQEYDFNEEGVTS